MTRIAEGMDVAAFVSEDQGAHHSHPARVTESQLRAALLKDGNLVDAQIGSIASACVSELQHLQPNQRITIKSGVMLAVFVDEEAIVVGRIDSGTVVSQTRHSVAAPPPSAEIMTLPAAPTATTPADNPRAKARAIYESAIAHYNLGEIKEALDAFKLAYRMFPESVLLFNIAQCHRRLGQAPQAAEMYRAFLRETPNAPNRAAVDRFIEEMDRAPR
jgi:tetratricopeptide (TPR) repeat protein